MRREYEALSKLVGRNFAVLDDGISVYLTPDGEIRDVDGKILMAADAGRAKLFEKNLKSGEGGGVSREEFDRLSEEISGGEPFKQYVTDGEGKTAWEDRLAWKERKLVDISWDGDVEGRVAVYNLHKVSPLVLENDDIKSGYLEVGDQKIVIADVWQELEAEGLVTEDFVGLDCAFFARKANVGFGPVKFPEAGVYFATTDDGTYVRRFVCECETFKTISSEYITGTALTEAENGKVLGVEEGKFKLVDGGNGGGVFIINASTQDYSSYTLDKSFSEIKEAIANGENPFIRFEWGPNKNQVQSYIARYESSNSVFDDANELHFNVHSGFPNEGYLFFNVGEYGTALNLIHHIPYPKKKGGYLVGLSGFEWELTDAPIVYSPNGTKFKITVDDSGVISATKAT